jgi:hypothetical protein
VIDLALRAKAQPIDRDIRSEGIPAIGALRHDWIFRDGEWSDKIGGLSLSGATITGNPLRHNHFYGDGVANSVRWTGLGTDVFATNPGLEWAVMVNVSRMQYGGAVSAIVVAGTLVNFSWGLYYNQIGSLFGFMSTNGVALITANSIRAIPQDGGVIGLARVGPALHISLNGEWIGAGGNLVGATNPATEFCFMNVNGVGPAPCSITRFMMWTNGGFDLITNMELVHRIRMETHW